MEKTVGDNMAEPVSTGLLWAGVTGGSNLLNVLFQWQGMKEQKREAKKTRAFEKETFERTFAEEKRATRVAEKQRKEEFALQQDTLNFNKRQTFISNFLTGLNKNPSAQANFIQLSRGRR